MKFINMFQTKDERKAKYHLCRRNGKNSSWAKAMRDWRLSQINKFLNLNLVYDQQSHQYTHQNRKFSLRPDGRIIHLSPENT